MSAEILAAPAPDPDVNQDLISGSGCSHIIGRAGDNSDDDWCFYTIL